LEGRIVGTQLVSSGSAKLVISFVVFESDGNLLARVRFASVAPNNEISHARHLIGATTPYKFGRDAKVGMLDQIEPPNALEVEIDSIKRFKMGVPRQRACIIGLLQVTSQAQSCKEKA
jgi:hypothetical protein